MVANAEWKVPDCETRPRMEGVQNEETGHETDA
jgi:hypothetical protein